jgi:TolB-like protein/class 3 adenylate cyclase
MERRLSAILALDVVGYSRLMGMNEAATLSAVKTHQRELVDVEIARHSGRVVKLMGDGILAEFSSVVNALACAVAIQQAMPGRNETAPPEQRIEFRIGINLGDVIVEEGDIFGDGVNVATRLEGISAPGGICVSASVREQVGDRLSVQFESLGEQALKNIAQPVLAYQVVQAGLQPGGALPNHATTASPAARDRTQPSVVVMPFDNLSGKEDEYFVDGVVEEITAALSRVRDFFVIARQSAFTYKGRFIDVRTIGKELGVNYVVEGTVRRGGNRLRISVHLVDVETRKQLWSDRFEGVTENIFEFQDMIAAQVAGAIHPAIRGAEIELATRRPPASLRAYDLVMRAYPHLWGRRKENTEEAISLLTKAIAADPSYGRAHALLAWCHASRAAYLWSDQAKQELDIASSALDAAGSIGNDPVALTAAGAAMSMSGDVDRATSFIEKALSLDPNNAWAWARYGWIGIYKGDDAKARERFERAMALSPMDPLAFNVQLGVATALARSGQLDEATAIARQVIATNPEVVMSYRYLAAWAAMNGDLETAHRAARLLMQYQPQFTIERYCSLPFFRHTRDWADRVAQALKLAGLPER